MGRKSVVYALGTLLLLSLGWSLFSMPRPKPMGGVYYTAYVGPEHGYCGNPAPKGCYEIIITP